MLFLLCAAESRSSAVGSVVFREGLRWRQFFVPASFELCVREVVVSAVGCCDFVVIFWVVAALVIFLRHLLLQKHVTVSCFFVCFFDVC